jgi:hypothetical protein
MLSFRSADRATPTCAAPRPWLGNDHNRHRQIHLDDAGDLHPAHLPAQHRAHASSLKVRPDGRLGARGSGFHPEGVAVAELIAREPVPHRRRQELFEITAKRIRELLKSVFSKIKEYESSRIVVGRPKNRLSGFSFCEKIPLSYDFGARSVALALTSVRRSNWTCIFPASSFHGWACAAWREGIREIRSTSLNSSLRSRFIG